jgi:hypothetical protein
VPSPPPEHAIEQVFDGLSAMLLTNQTDRWARWGHRAPVCTGQQRTILVRD